MRWLVVPDLAGDRSPDNRWTRSYQEMQLIGVIFWYLTTTFEFHLVFSANVVLNRRDKFLRLRSILCFNFSTLTYSHCRRELEELRGKYSCLQADHSGCSRSREESSLKVAETTSQLQLCMYNVILNSTNTNIWLVLAILLVRNMTKLMIL